MRHLDLFSGIGGASLAADAVWDDVEHVFCEIDPFCQAVLRKHWPNSLIYGDIKELKDTDVGTVDLLTGGFPCQPFSSAGRRRGTEDDRHLWPEMLRVIRETNPRWVIGENVGGLLTWNGGMVLDEVCTDLESEGYEVGAFVIPACAVNAPHRRDRVWIVAHSLSDRTDRGAPGKHESTGQEERLQEWDEVEQRSEPANVRLPGDPEYPRRNGTEDRKGSDEGGDGNEAGTHEDVEPARPVMARGDAADSPGEQAQPSKPCRLHPELGSSSCDVANATGERRNAWRPEREGQQGHPTPFGDSAWDEDWPTVAARLCTVDDGLPDGLARPRGWRNAALKGAGNAWVPQVAAEIMRAIKEIDL